MIILTVTKKGTVKLPKEVLDHLRDTRHLQLRFNSHGVTLTPVDIRSVADLKAIPEPDTKQTHFQF